MSGASKFTPEGLAVATAVMGVMLIRFYLAKRNVRRRNREMDAWAAAISLTEAQTEAIMRLWQAYLAEEPPAVDPLEGLSREELRYLLKVCSSDYRPREFGEVEPLQQVIYERLTGEGWTPEQAVVIVGVMFNCVGKQSLEMAQ